MEWSRIPRSENLVELAALVSEAEIVLEFSQTVRGWFRVSIFEDLQSTDPDGRFFARAAEKDDPAVQAVATASTPEEAATQCIREAGVSLRRARGR